MKMDIELVEKAERYLNGEMSIDETNKFENILAANANLLEFTEQHQQLIDALQVRYL